MKKLLLCMLVLLMSLSLFACGGTGDETTDPSGNNTDPSHVHAYEEVVVLEPTCIATGKKAMQCSCGDIQSEEELPMADHAAGFADCENDAVCSVCGAVAQKKYGHSFVETVVSEASCSAEGLTRSTCQLCGAASDITVPADPNKHVSDYSIADGKLSFTFKNCGKSEEVVEETPILKFEFNSDDEFAQNPAFAFNESSTRALVDGAMQITGSYQVKYDQSVLAAAKKLFLTFDIKLTHEGIESGSESLFLITKKENGSTKYGWLIKYIESEKVLATVTEGFNEENSVKVGLNEWHNFSAIIDVAECEAKIYIDGKYIGTREFYDQSRSNVEYKLRFFGAPSSNKSNPMFDNFKLVEIK